MLRQDIIRLVQATILPDFIIATLAIAHRYRQPFPKAIGQSLGITLTTDGTTVNLCHDPAHWQAIDKREAKPMPHPSGDTLFANGGLIKPVTEPVTITNGQLNLVPLGLQTVTPQPMLPPFSKCPTCRVLPTPIKQRHASGSCRRTCLPGSSHQRFHDKYSRHYRPCNNLDNISDLSIGPTST